MILKANPGVDTASWKWRIPSGLIKPKEARTAHQAEYGGGLSRPVKPQGAGTAH